MKEYKFLKAGRVIFKILAWIILGLAIIIGVIILITGGGKVPIMTPAGIEIPPTPRAAGLVFMLMGAFYFFILYSISEIIAILLDMKSCCPTKPTV